MKLTRLLLLLLLAGSASHAVLPDGRILVSGNWYADDAIGISDGTGPFEIVQRASQDRMCPYVFPDGRDSAVIFGGCSSTNELRTAIVDCLDGASYVPELFERWSPYEDFHSIRMDDCKAVDPQSGREAYLFGAFDEKNGSSFTISESRPFSYYWPATPDGPWFVRKSITAEEYATIPKTWPADAPLP